MSDPTYPLFPVFSFVASFLALIPLPWHLQAWNAGTCLYMMWASLASLAYFVDSIIWHSSVDNVAPIWCDISTKFIVGAGVGIPASTLCINRRLYSIASVQAVSITRKDKQRAVIIDCAIAIGLPVLVMILHYVVQGHRFNILEGVGCLPTTVNTPAAYPLVFMWPMVLGSISFVYAALTLRAFLKRRAQFNELLSSGSSSLTVSRYFRLMLLSCLEMACTLPLGIFSVYINTHGVRMVKWVSWADTHFNFSFVQMIPALVWRNNQPFKISVEMSRWIFPACSLMFFLLFGFAEEARRNYRAAFKRIIDILHIRRSSPKSEKRIYVESPSLPRFNKPSYLDESLPEYTPRNTLHSDVEKESGKNSNPDVSFSSEKTDTSSTYSYPIRFSQLSSPSRPISHVIDITIPSSPLGSVSESGSSTACTGPLSPYHDHHAI